MRAHSKPLAGIAYLVLIVLLVTASIQAFRKELPWQGAATVTLTTSTPGLELNPLSDVKFQGLRVGEVRRITSDGRSARIELALDEGKLDLLPQNVDAAIVPKTLFGEKFVDLRLPDSPSTARLAAGGVIRQSTTSVEIGALFSKLVPVLDALKPEQLSVILNSLAQALDGRGETLARGLVQLDAFLGEVEPNLDTLTDGFGKFARTAEIYADAAPDLLQILSATAGISRELLIPKEERFGAFLDQVIGTSDQTEEVLAENADSLIRLSGRSRPVLALLNEYAKSLPCTLEGLRAFGVLSNHAIGAQGPFTNLVVDVLANNAPYTNPDDLPTSPNSEQNNANLPKDIPGWEPHCAEFSEEVLALKDPAPYSQPMAGTAIPPTRRTTVSPAAVEEARAAMAKVLAAQKMGIPTDQVPGYAGLLIAPLLSDGEVNLP